MDPKEVSAKSLLGKFTLKAANTKSLGQLTYKSGYLFEGY